MTNSIEQLALLIEQLADLRLKKVALPEGHGLSDLLDRIGEFQTSVRIRLEERFTASAVKIAVAHSVTLTRIARSDHVPQSIDTEKGGQAELDKIWAAIDEAAAKMGAELIEEFRSRLGSLLDDSPPSPA